MKLNSITKLTFFLSLIFSINIFAANFNIENLHYFESKEKVTLKKDHRIFVLFWATWCTTCKIKITEIIPELRKEYKNTTFLALNIDKDQDRVKHYIDKNEIKEDVVIDPDGILTKNLNNNIAPFWAVFDYDNKSSSWKLLKHQSGFEKSIYIQFLKK